MANNQGMAALMNARRNKARLSVSFGQSHLHALMLEDANQKFTSLSSDFLVAFCGLSGEGATGWMTSRGLTALAHHIFEHTDQFLNLDEGLRRALKFGALTAMWMNPQNFEYNDGQINAARNRLLSAARSKMPTLPNIREALTRWCQMLKTDNSQIRHFLMAQHFPIQMTMAADQVDLIFSQCYPADENIPQTIPSNEVIQQCLTSKPEADMRAAWSRLHTRELIGFFTVLGYENAEMDAEYLAAVFTMTVTVSKSSFTDQWIASRWSNLREEISYLQNIDEVSGDTLVHYERLYQRMNISIEQKVGCLIIINWLTIAVNIESIGRIVSQARAPHVSGLTALCDLALKYESVSYTWLDKILGRHQIHNVINLACEIIHNPFCTLIGPPIVVAAYADIAFLATEIAYNLENPRRGASTYISPAAKSIKKSKVFLTELASGIVEAQRIAAESMSSAKSIVNAFDRFILKEDRQNYLVADDNVLLDNDDNDLVTLAHANHHLNINLRVIKKTEILTFVQGLRTDKDNAFRVIMEVLANTIAMEPMPTLEEVSPDQYSQLIKTKPLPESVVEALRKLEIDPPARCATSESLIKSSLYVNYRVADQNHYSTVHHHTRVPQPRPQRPIEEDGAYGGVDIQN